ncbi:hypothetical protein ATN84_08930 [Paramesorhizobium deserti]|uniref:Extensin-like C-terminal domain-containing protein n=1 Tax=Paramesorhizobium deserti TaxID=1494590 RepID=A0A135HXA2_9HYPH|nr:hypothetical protein ATN84_08930 [Paramesorhizobium deserti]
MCRNGLFTIIAAALCLFIAPDMDMPTISGQAKAENILDVFKPKTTRKRTTRTRRTAQRKQSQRPRRSSTSAGTKAAPALGAVPVPQPKPGSEEAKPAEKQPQTEQKGPAPTPEEKPQAEPQGTPPVPATPPAKTDDAAPHDEKTVEEKDERVYQAACPALMNGDVQGKLVAPLSDGICGERSPLSLTAIGKEPSLPFASPIITNCAMAVTLAQWSSGVRAAALKSFGSEIEAIGTGSDYQCRKVNGASSGRTSEHAFANALDIMSFRLKNGRTTELATGWDGTPEEKEFWRAVHKTSCDMFMTVIGPDGDAAHKTNLHLDQGCHGGNCTSRICQ